MPRNGEDVLGPVRRIAKSFAKRADVVGQAVFADEAVGPDERDQFGLLQDAAFGRHQRPKQVEGLGRKWHDMIGSPEFPRAAIQAVRSELITFGGHYFARIVVRVFRVFTVISA